MLQFLIFIGGMFGFGICLIGSQRHFKKAVEIEQAQFPEQWIKDGRPSGYAIVSRSMLSRSDLSSVILMTSWFFYTRQWARQVTPAAKHIARMRLFAILGFLSCAVSSAVSFYFVVLAK